MNHTGNKILPPYFSPLLPIIITGPGRYITRGGEVVTIEKEHKYQSGQHWDGAYANGTPEHWHRTGRIFPATDTTNDIVSPAKD